MPAPVNFAQPTVSVLRGADFVALNAQAGGNADFREIVIKGAYLLGTALDIFEGVTVLVEHPRARSVTYRLAFGVFASAVDLLGRALSGNSTISPKAGRGATDIQVGFEYLRTRAFPIPPSAPRTGAAVITTSSAAYSAADLIALRHFAAHGQATAKFSAVDDELLSRCPGLFGDAIEAYWAILHQNASASSNLAAADIIPVASERVKDVWGEFSRGLSAGQLFYRYGDRWKV